MANQFHRFRDYGAIPDADPVDSPTYSSRGRSVSAGNERMNRGNSTSPVAGAAIPPPLPPPPGATLVSVNPPPVLGSASADGAGDGKVAGRDGRGMRRGSINGTDDKKARRTRSDHDLSPVRPGLLHSPRARFYSERKIFQPNKMWRRSSFEMFPSHILHNPNEALLAGVEEAEEEGVELGPDYDTSPEHLIKFFNILDSNQSGSITPEQLRIGIANLGTLSDLSYSMRQWMMQKTAEGTEGAEITLQDFVTAVQDHAAHLYEEKTKTPIKVMIYDYGPETFVEREMQIEDDAETTMSPGQAGGMPKVTCAKFLKEEVAPPSPHHVRFVDVVGVEPSFLIRMSNKYNIHPLMVEDTLNPKERLKVDISSNRLMHVLLAKISLQEPSPAWPSYIRKEQVSIYLVDNSTVLFIERGDSVIGQRLADRMMYAGSKLRLNDARFLVYSVVDAIVDEIFPITKHFHQWLLDLQSKVHSADNTPLDVVKEIQQINRDMNMLQFYIRPMKPVVAQLRADLPEGEGGDTELLRRHLQDLYDHVLVLEEQAIRMVTWSRSLNDDYLNEQQHHMNKVMLWLTMVTSAFLPAQFLTGVWGMNFENMPELGWKYAYGMFWCLIALIPVTVFRFYRNQKWL